MPYKDPAQQRAYQREWCANRRERWFRNKVCAECGSKENLELDHIFPDHKVNHRIWSWSWKRIAEETAKCQVLCHDCHIKKTRIDFDQHLEHGTSNGYQYYGCRCPACRKAHVEQVNAWRWKTGRRKKSDWSPHFTKRAPVPIEEMA